MSELLDPAAILLYVLLVGLCIVSVGYLRTRVTEYRERAQKIPSNGRLPSWVQSRYLRRVLTVSFVYSAVLAAIPAGIYQGWQWEDASAILGVVLFGLAGITTWAERVYDTKKRVGHRTNRLVNVYVLFAAILGACFSAAVQVLMLSSTGEFIDLLLWWVAGLSPAVWVGFILRPLAGFRFLAEEQRVSNPS